MPIWDKILKAVDRTLASDANRSGENSPVLRAEHYALVDTEVGLRDHKIHDIGALR